MGELIPGNFSKEPAFSFVCGECGATGIQWFNLLAEPNTHGDPEDAISVVATCKECSTSYFTVVEFEDLERE